jgi:hypothetical protein
MRAVVAGLVAVLLSFGAREAKACSRIPCDSIVLRPSARGAESDLTSSEWAASAALTIARFGDPSQLTALGRTMQTPALLARLEAGRQMDCMLLPVVRALADNPLPEARAAFLGLLTSKLWAVHDERSDGGDRMNVLLRATGGLRPPGPKVVALWKHYSAPDDGWINVTVMALAENAAPEAAALLEARLLDARHDVETRVAWLHSDLLGNRDKITILRVARRVFDSKTARAVRWAAAEAVFDYRNEWYGDCGGPPSPVLSSYSAASRAELRAFAAKVSAQKPDAALSAAIARTLFALEAVEIGK